MFRGEHGYTEESQIDGMWMALKMAEKEPTRKVDFPLHPSERNTALPLPQFQPGGTRLF